jgi:hypothetical protein
MKLREILKPSYDKVIVKGIDFLGDENPIEPFDAVVYYAYEPEDHSYHPYGEGRVKETHPEQLYVVSIESATEVKQVDDDGNEVKTWPKGTDVTKLPDWDQDGLKWVQQQVESQLGLA